MAAAGNHTTLSWKDSFFHALWPTWVLAGMVIIWSEVSHTPIVISSSYFDVEHYLEISKNGYSQPFLTAFFPGFPALLFLLQSNIIAASIVNYLIWVCSASLLLRHKLITSATSMMAAVVPSALFFYLPYSESLFYFAISLIAIGLKKDSDKWLIAGIILASISRPTAAVILPALILARHLKGYSLQSAIKRTLPEILIAALTVVCVFTFQSLFTGSFTSFFTAQAGWGNGVHLASLPLHSFGGNLIFFYDSAAMLVGFISLAVIVHLFRSKHPVSSPHAFGLSALAITALLILFSRGGGIFSLNRFIFATAFFPLALEIFRAVQISKKSILVALAAAIALGPIFAAHVHIKSALMYLLTLGLITAYFWFLRQKSTTVRTGFAVMLIAIQAWFFVQYVLQGNWIA